MLCPDALPSPLWVLGTGTGVGKTQVAARLARAWAGLGPVAYRKPFQTGVDRARITRRPTPRRCKARGSPPKATSC
ncbi:MAG: hypothetical protein IPI84_10520 [Holophagaceae bacterium]|nr:hypothetical protein [Holophagaceae bacterium]